MTSRREPEPQKGPTAVTANKNRPPRTRSPNYPNINLKTAVAKAKTLYEGGAKRHPVGVEVIGEVWGHKPKSSAFKLALAAAQYFGLLEESANGDHKLLKLTPLALDIIADYAEDAPERLEAIKKAALRPKMHAELWQKWGAELPPDGEIRRYLVRERGFNDNTVGEFIAEYKSTLSFAKLGAADTLEEETPADDDEDLGMENPPPAKNLPPAPPTKNVPPGFKQDVYTLKIGEIVVRWPERIEAAADELEDLESWMEMIARKVKRSAKADPATNVQD